MKTSAVALALVLVGALAGCSGEEEQPRTLPPVGTPSPTVAAAPSPPAEALAETPQGAEAFAEYYFSLISDAYATGDTSQLEAASADGCGGCDSLVANIMEVAARGERQVSGDAIIKQVAAPAVQNGDVVLLVDFSVPTKTFADAQGKVVATTAPVPSATAQMRLIRRGTSWVVQGYRIV